MGLRGSDTVQLSLQNLEVPAENVLGREGKGFKIAMMAPHARCVSCAAPTRDRHHA